MIFMAGPGHGAPGVLGPAYLEGTYSEIYTDKSQDTAGLLEFFKQFSFPGGIGSHCTPETPGSIHEGGELGYVLSHACGAAFDNPALIVAAVVGDGEAETGPLATSWHISKFLNPIRDGAVLPILHLNGYKINNPPPCWLASATKKWKVCFEDTAGRPTSSKVPTRKACIRQWLPLWSTASRRSERYSREARSSGLAKRPRWPMIVLRTPKGWSAPARGKRPQTRGFLASAPGSHGQREEGPGAPQDSRKHGCATQRPEELFDKDGKLISELKQLMLTRQPANERQSARQRGTSSGRQAHA